MVIYINRDIFGNLLDRGSVALVTASWNELRLLRLTQGAASDLTVGFVERYRFFTAFLNVMLGMHVVISV